MKVYLKPYKAGSKGAKALAAGLSIKRIKVKGSRFKPNYNKVVINWGCSEFIDSGKCTTVFNTPEAVALASNKLSFFNHVSGGEVNLPPHFTNKEDVPQDVKVVVRKVLTGSAGAGIVICDKGEVLPDAPLYTQYIPKVSEWRVHIIGGDVVDVQQKRRKKDCNNPNWEVRNHDNGFVFARNNLDDYPEGLEEQAKLVVNKLGLFFGAVDIVYNKKQNKCYVLEVNTAPGLEGTTLTNYVNKFKEILNVAL